VPAPATRGRYALVAGVVSALCLLGTARALRTPTPARMDPRTDGHTTRLLAAARAARPSAPARRPAVLLREDCAACHALVRTLARRVRVGLATPPLTVLVDRSWPELRALAAAGAATVQHTPAVRDLPITPALVHSMAPDAPPVIRYGVPHIVALLDSLPSPRSIP
jgi:hypothetical protein